MTAGIPKVLFVNLPPRLRASLTTSPSGDTMPYGVRTAGNLQEALAVLTEDDIFSVLIAVETAETVRDHLLREIRAGYPHIDIMTLLPEGDPSLAGQIPEDLHVQVLHHPVDVAALVEQLTAQSRRRGQGFAGTLKNIQIDDLIQMCCLSMATIAIRVAKDNQQGIIYIRDGEVVHAVCAEVTGEEAFYRILGWASGRFETVDDRHEGDDSIDKSPEFLLMEAARRSDEAHGEEAETAESPAETAGNHTERLKILLVEDSTLMAKILSSMLTATGEMDVVGIAQNGQDALEMTQSLFPDLILLDVNMPVMDGSTALKHIMIRTPCPVVVMSNIGSGSPEAVFQFLDLGAVDFMAKPVKNKDLLLQQQKIVSRIKRAAAADIKNFRRGRSFPEQNPAGSPSPFPASPSDQLLIIATGCSAHSELTQLLSQLPNDHNLAIIVLHTLPPTFIPSLARHLDKQSAFSVAPLTNGSLLQTGTCYLGTPGHALRTISTGREMVVEISSHRHKDPGQDVSYLDLFLCSAADCYPGSLMVTVLSGAEAGNLEGLRYVQERGARIIVQDPATCMVAEAPASVVAAGLAGTVAAPAAITENIRMWAGNIAE